MWGGAGLSPSLSPLAPACPRRHKALQLQSTVPILPAAQGHVCRCQGARQRPAGAGAAGTGSSRAGLPAAWAGLGFRWSSCSSLSPSWE